MRTRVRLAAMMFLTYGIQGAWWPLLSLHLDDLNISGRHRGWIFATLALSALVTPLWAGRLADRRVAAQKLLAIIYALGTVLLAVVGFGLASTFAGLFPLFLAYWLLTAPYLGLSSTIAMRNLERPREEFGGIRLWGTVGWMASGWLVAAVMSLPTGPKTHGAHEAFWIASSLSAVLAIGCLFLPNTPPLASGTRGIPWREATAMLKRPGVAVVLFAGFAVSLTTPFVYQAVPKYLRDIGLPRARIASAMTLGQVPEIIALGLLPLVLARFGRRTTMAAGIASWVVYHALFASQPSVILALVAIPLNGFAIAFFHVAAPMYLDSQAPPNRRAGVQSLWVMITSGLGCLAGGLLAGEVMEHAGNDWRLVFAIPASIALALLIAFLVAFRPEAAATPSVEILPVPVGGAAARAVALSPEPGER
jgi:nucleoside transporter